MPNTANPSFFFEFSGEVAQVLSLCLHRNLQNVDVTGGHGGSRGGPPVTRHGGSRGPPPVTLVTGGPPRDTP